MVDLSALPDIQGFAMMKLKVECPSLAVFEFAGPKEPFQLSELQIWKFAFFDVVIDELEVFYGESFSPARSISIRRISLGEWKFEVYLALEEGSVLLRCREVFFFSCVATEHPGN